MFFDSSILVASLNTVTSDTTITVPTVSTTKTKTKYKQRVNVM